MNHQHVATFPVCGMSCCASARAPAVQTSHRLRTPSRCGSRSLRACRRALPALPHTAEGRATEAAGGACESVRGGGAGCAQAHRGHLRQRPHGVHPGAGPVRGDRHPGERRWCTTPHAFDGGTRRSRTGRQQGSRERLLLLLLPLADNHVLARRIPRHGCCCLIGTGEHGVAAAPGVQRRRQAPSAALAAPPHASPRYFARPCWCRCTGCCLRRLLERVWCSRGCADQHTGRGPMIASAARHFGGKQYSSRRARMQAWDLRCSCAWTSAAACSFCRSVLEEP